MKKFIKIITGILILLFFLGPGWSYIYTPQIKNVDINEDVDDYVARKEAQFANIKDRNEAHILWSDPEHKKTSMAFVYLHGFSAGPKEISPVVENVAVDLKMNSYYQRFSAHGLKDELMESLSSDQLFQDAEEAYSIGKKLGDNVILVGTSTGASLSLWLAARHPDIRAIILISPNLGIKDPRGFLAAGPLGYYIARLVAGPYHAWIPKHLGQEQFWTTKYSVNGVRAMTDVVNEVTSLNFQSIKTPTLVFSSPFDSVINVEKALAYLQELGASNKTFIKYETAEHVLAGQITAPANVSSVSADIIKFINQNKNY